jgi:ketosteroid isomerase-like protein
MTDSQGLQQLLDKDALRDLVTTYCRAIDRRDYKLLRSLYTDDAVEDRGDTFSGSIDEFIAAMPAMVSGFVLTMHRVSNMLFQVQGDYAEGEIYAEAYHRTPPPDFREITACGRYMDRYQKRDGVWRIQYRAGTVDRCEIHPASEEAYSNFVATQPMGRPDGQDLSYKALKLFPRMGA